MVCTPLSTQYVSYHNHENMIIHVFIWHPMLKTIAIVAHDYDYDTEWSDYFSTLQDVPPMHHCRPSSYLVTTKWP